MGAVKIFGLRYAESLPNRLGRVSIRRGVAAPQPLTNLAKIGIPLATNKTLTMALTNRHLAIDNDELMRRVEDLINASKNRYRITVQVANRAKRRRYEDPDDMEDGWMKPIRRAVIEMSDELTEPEIIGDE
ncbi:MAG: DNA-directed RNA polymerase subunit omega [Thermostichus sp. DG02_5_bins_236]